MFLRLLLIAIVEKVFIETFLGQAEHLDMKMDDSRGLRPK
jgi:hypothetical protein